MITIKTSMVVITVVVCIIMLCGGAVFAGNAFDPFSSSVLNNGSTWNLVDNDSSGGGTVNVQSLNPLGNGGEGLVGQPDLTLTSGNTTVTGYGMCMDSAHWLYGGQSYSGYQVYSWAAAVSNGCTGTINPATTDQWNRLTYMWATAVVNSDQDRAALQLATWVGCADQWNSTPVNGNWDGANLDLDGISDTALITQAETYIADSANYTGAYANQFDVLSAGDSSNDPQTFVVETTAVPEPTALLLAGMGLSGSLVFVRRRRGSL
jgi:hypothetical protein